LCRDILTVQHTVAVRVFGSLYLLSLEMRDSGWDVAILMTMYLLAQYITQPVLLSSLVAFVRSFPLYLTDQPVTHYT